MHWADLYAEKLAGKAGKHVIETGTSISGIPHIGNASDVIRGDAVRKALEERGIPVELIWVADDGDPFRKTPAGMEHLKEHLGKPVYDVPDPVGGCHKNFVEHFSRPFIDDLALFGVRSTVFSGTELYRGGALADEIKVALEKGGEIAGILNKFRKTPLPEDWIPWSPVCGGCGRISTTHAEEWDGDRIVKYVCSGVDPETHSKDLKDVSGCGHRGESDVTRGEGKLPWRVEWAARWRHFKVTCEPFGKEHATVGGSYDTSKLISAEVFGWEPPLSVVYEFFTLNGEKISSSKGNVITLSDWNKIAEPEVLKYLMYKRLEKQRDVDLSKIPNLSDEYDEAEKAFFGGGDPESARMYGLSQVAAKPKPCGVPYSLCVVLSQITPPDASAGGKQFDVNQRKVEVMGYAPDKSRLGGRLLRAWEWSQTEYCPDYLRFDLHEGVGVSTLPEEQQSVLKLISGELERSWTPEEFHKRIYEISREVGVKPDEAFKAVYLVLIGKERGPKAASFILSLDKDFVCGRFGYFK